MASSSVYHAMGEKNSNASNTCNTPFTGRDLDPNGKPKSAFSYFIRFSIKRKSGVLTNPLTQVRIKIPRMLTRALLKHPSSNTDTNSSNSNNKRMKTRTLFPKKAASLLSNVFHRKKASKAKTDSEDHLYMLAPETPLSEVSAASKEILEIKDEGAKETSLPIETVDLSVVPSKPRPKMWEKASLILSKVKSSIPNVSTDHGSLEGECRMEKVDKRFKSCGVLGRFFINRKAKKAVSSDSDDEEKAEDLCKKRILMGGRCRRSGKQYSGFPYHDLFGNPLPEFPQEGTMDTHK